MRWLSSRKSPAVRAFLYLGLAAAGLGVVALAPADRAATAQPANPPVVGPEYVPADAAVFYHVDAAKLWGGPLGKAVRAADPKTFDGLTTQAKSLFGVTPDALRSVTAFWPKLKGPQDSEAFGVVLAFNAAYDKDKLKAGFGTLLPAEAKVTIHAPSDRVAVLLVGLDGGYATPRPADQTGPLTGAIREAASGKHLVVAGTTTANLPDVIRSDDPPPDIRPFLPLFRAESVVGIVDLDKDLSVEVRVRAATPPKAVEAEKALGLIRNLLQEGLTRGTKELGKDNEKDPALKDLFVLLKDAQTGLKDARFTTDGTETRARVAIPADLPFGPAVAAAVAKAREAAVRAQSANNLKQIGIAMHAYHDVNGTFPPAAVVDKTGKPMLSWRVLILPYVEQDALYKQFKLDEPWDSDHNKKLLDKMPGVYAIPGDTKTKPTETRYRVFVGNGAGFDYLKGPKLTEITDGTSNTIMAVTAAEAVPWTKPDELAFDPDKDMTKLLGTVHGGRIQAAFFDGSVRSFAKPPARKTLNAYITRAGGEVIEDPGDE
ncbi:MAG: hypothetical protein JWO38_6678 [Gemmataceae bacterium]|nr:hypothetical protein [Gemmataceae bacterium]